MPRPVDCELIEFKPDRPSVGPPVLFVHGVRHAAWCWERWQRRLAARGIHSAAISLRGHGASAGRVTGATLGAYVHDVVAAAAKLPAAPVLVGHSMGGIIVQRAVHRTPVQGMALVAPGPAHNGVPFALRFACAHPVGFLQVLLGRSLPFAPQDLVSDAVAGVDAAAIMGRIGRESAIAQYQITMPRRPPRRAPCPVLLLGTPNDPVIPAVEVRRCSALQGVPVRWLPGLAHDIMLEPGGDAGADELADWVTGLR